MLKGVISGLVLELRMNEVLFFKAFTYYETHTWLETKGCPQKINYSLCSVLL